MKSRSTLTVVIAVFGLTLVASGQRGNRAETLLGAGQHQEQVGDCKEAITLYAQVLKQPDVTKNVAARARLYTGFCQEQLGQRDARATYEAVLKEYPEQSEITTRAQTRLTFLAAQRRGTGDVRSTMNGPVLSKLWTETSPGADHTVMAVSPDGRYLVTASKSGLLIHDVSLEEKDRYLRSAPSPDGRIAFPCFTPDGKRVVYEIGKDSLTELRTINTDGTGEKTILTLKGTEYSELEISAISPDGKLAAVNLFKSGPTRPGWWHIGLISVQTGSLKILRSLDLGLDAYVGNFSPDGRWLAYASDLPGEGNESAIYAIAVDGSGHNMLVTQQMSLGTPFFSRDGSRVVTVFSKPGTRRALYSIPVADGKKLGPPEIVREDMPPGSPDVMGFDRDGALYLSESVNQSSIHVAEVDATTWKLKNPPREISDPSRHENVAEPAWSPSGKLLAFVDSATEKKLVIQDFDSRKERELSAPLTQMSFRGWLPNGKSVLLNGPPTGVRLVDTDTQRESPLSLMIAGPVTSSSDGKYLFYFRGDTPTAGQTRADSPIQLIRRDLQTGDERELYRFEGWRPSVNMLAASPDGRNLAFVYAGASNQVSRTLWVLPLSGDEPRPRRLAGIGWEWGETVAFTWTQDGKAVLFVRSKDEIWVQPVDAGSAYSTGIRMASLDSLSIHPDGSRIAFVVHKRSTPVWKLQNLFPQVSTTK